MSGEFANFSVREASRSTPIEITFAVRRPEGARIYLHAQGSGFYLCDGYDRDEFKHFVEVAALALAAARQMEHDDLMASAVA